ncbi:extracellular solute-binding protein [Pseudokineococcus sp. 5B2Z-1]|uniref:extracellular solute-binding protein n=1 Tax=Pseudokineococcus sp. 5B2Z-1 TaxID=3132744 RepID=UPI0030A4D23F
MPLSLALAGGLLTACGDDAGAVPELSWYINNVNDESIAQRCSEEAEGYTISTVLLPNNASGQREQILRRLAAEDSSIDVISLDPPYMAELANAGFLRAFTDAEREEFTEGVLDGPVEQSTFDDQLYAAPFFGNTQLLWYKKSVAEEAGLDMSRPVTWDQIIDAAEQTGTTVAAQGRRNESLMVWVNALVESDGGTILEDGDEAQSADEVVPTIDSPAGAEAARIMSDLARSPAAPPALATAGEEESRAAFQSDSGGFMVNWPYVWAAFAAAEESGVVPADFSDDVAWTRYPRVDPEIESATPIGGVSLSVGAFSEHPDLAVDAVRCLRSAESQKEHMLGAGDPASLAEVYDDPEVQEAFPMWEDIRSGLVDAAPRPVTPYYGDVTGVLQAGYHPPDELDPETTPEATARLMRGVLSNQQLL